MGIDIPDTIKMEKQLISQVKVDERSHLNMIRMEYYKSVEELPVSIWKRFVSGGTVGLEINHLRAIEVSQINEIHPYYLIGYHEDEAVGIAYCFSIDVNFAGMSNSYPPDILSTVKTWKPDFMNVRIVEVGHIASLGTTIEVMEPFLEEFLVAFSNTINEIASLEKADLCLIRDIAGERYAEFNVLEKYGYMPVMGFPIARMDLKWNSIDGYLASLKTKKRSNIRRKRSNLIAPEISVEIIEDYAPYSERLAELWTNVAINNNGYEHERLTPEFFEAMSVHLKGRSHVVAIKQHGKIVAFGLNLIGDEELFGMAEGLDYNLRDVYDLYANNIFEGLRVACELGKKKYNIGITTYDFKTSIGAELDPCVYLVKAFKNPCYTPVYANIIRKSIEQPVNIHRAFKECTTLNRPQHDEPKTPFQRQDDPLDPFAKHLRYIRVDTVRSADLYTYCPVFESAQEPVIKHNGRDVIMLGTNSYLGLATHPKVKEAAHEAIDKYGSGCSGSPLLNGTLDIHRELACELARFTRKQDALIFSTGYQTNVGAISALVNRDDILIMDERNHASLLDGARLSRATLVRYKHNNIDSLEESLKKYADKPKLVVTDSLFSMEGTMIDLPEMVRLVKHYHARLLLDESHALGVIGPNGRGVAEHFGLMDEVDIIMGTFSKSLASIGGFIAGDRKILDTLRHTARSHIFSASLPPSAVAVVMAAIRVIDEEPERRFRLLENARFMANGLAQLGFSISYQGSAIIPVFCGHELLTVAAFHKLFDEGIFVNPVTSPAVPKNQEMLRISLMATHDESMLLKALDVFKRIRTINWPGAQCYTELEHRVSL